MSKATKQRDPYLRIQNQSGRHIQVHLRREEPPGQKARAGKVIDLLVVHGQLRQHHLMVVGKSISSGGVHWKERSIIANIPLGSAQAGGLLTVTMGILAIAKHCNSDDQFCNCIQNCSRDKAMQYA